MQLRRDDLVAKYGDAFKKLEGNPYFDLVTVPDQELSVGQKVYIVTWLGDGDDDSHVPYKLETNEIVSFEPAAVVRHPLAPQYCNDAIGFLCKVEGYDGFMLSPFLDISQGLRFQTGLSYADSALVFLSAEDARVYLEWVKVSLTDRFTKEVGSINTAIAGLAESQNKPAAVLA